MTAAPEVDYARLESLLKEASALLDDALGNIEDAEILLPGDLSSIVAQDRIMTARKMTNRLRNHLDGMKS